MYRQFSGRSFIGRLLSGLMGIRFFCGFFGFIMSLFFGGVLLLNMFSTQNYMSSKLLAVFLASSLFLLLIGPYADALVYRITAIRGLRLRPDLRNYISEDIIKRKVRCNLESYCLDDPDPWVWSAVIRTGRS